MGMAAQMPRGPTGPASACHAPAKPQYKQQIQPDVQQRRSAQKPEGRHGVSRRPQQAGKEIVKERGGQPCKDDEKVRPHGRIQLLRDLQKAQDRVDEQVDRQRQHQRYQQDQHERMSHRPARASRLPRPR